MMIRLRRSMGLQARFLTWVLLPPFVLLAVFGVAGYFVLNITIQDSETETLRRVATTTSTKLEQEFDLRKSVLVGTGNQIFDTKAEYSAKADKLENQYNSCHDFLLGNVNFGVNKDCRPFYAGFADVSKSSGSLIYGLNQEYPSQFKQILTDETAQIDKLLGTYTKFFPDSKYVLVVDKEGMPISSATTGETLDSQYINDMEAMAKSALKAQIQAKYVASSGVDQLVFAYPAESGSILAAYDLDSGSVLYKAWKDAPLDSNTTYMLIADTASHISYPRSNDTSLYSAAFDKANDGKTSLIFKNRGVKYLAVVEDVKGTTWKVIVASPVAYALSSLANAQMLAVAIIGTLLIIFVLVGSLFIRKITKSIMALVAGAVVFSSGQLTHRIDIASMSDNEFIRLAESMNTMAAKIEQAEEEIDKKDKEFINVATHEIRAPLTAIIGNLSMIIDDGMGSVDEEAGGLMNQAYKSTLRLRDLVNELLDIARLESGRAEFNLSNIDLDGEITDMIEIQNVVAHERNITIDYASEHNPIMVYADKSKLEIILTNFLSNAIKYNNPGGNITVNVVQNAGEVEISIKDNGMGIPDDQKAKMFEKFFRVEASDRANIVGTGLGLYLTKQFIEGMGGKVWFDSKVGEGTTFYFTIPRISTGE